MRTATPQLKKISGNDQKICDTMNEHSSDIFSDMINFYNKGVADKASNRKKLSYHEFVLHNDELTCKKENGLPIDIQWRLSVCITELIQMVIMV